MSGRALAVALWTMALAGCAAGGHSGAVVAVAFSADGRRAVTAGVDRTLRVWNAEDGRAVATLEIEAAGAPAAAAFAGAGRVVAHDGARGLRVFDIARGEETARLPAPSASALAVSPDAARVALLDADALTVIDLESGRALWSAALRSATPAGYRPALRHVAFDADGGRLLVSRVATKDGKAYVVVDTHDARTGEALRRLTPPEPPAEAAGRAAAAAPDGTRKIVGLEDGTVRCLDPASGRELWSVPGR